ncbi:hypothetical protein KR084_012039 [Drosophila pseudotakahashii]|nr:hypothetical protein KR084_012039 [Drosophila pseudotakahashii]
MILNQVNLRNVNQLLYGTALLTTIGVSPIVKLETRLGYTKALTSAKFFYPDILGTAIVCLVLTTMAMVPFLMTPNRWHKQNKMAFLLMLPWMLFCCLKFVNNVQLLSKAIAHVRDANVLLEPLDLVLVAYCFIFCLALEQMLSWCMIYLMLTDDMITWQNRQARLLLLDY